LVIGPAATFGPSMSPGPETDPIVPEPTPAAQTPQSDTTRPFTPSVDGGAPTSDDGGSTSRPSETPSSAYALSPSLLFFSIALVALKFYWWFLLFLCIPYVIWFMHRWL